MSRERDVLVVDDEPVVGQAVAKICAAEGLTVDVAARGAAGLERLRQRSYRLVVCDIMMADLDGFAFLAEAARRGLRTPVVMVTGYSTVDNAVRSLAAGAIDFLPKPFTEDELTSVVRRGLKYSKLQKTGWAPCPSGYFRLGTISWLKTEPEGSVLIGAGDAFLKTLEGVSAVELAPAGGEVIQGAPCAAFVSEGGARHGLLCPASGRVVERNERLAADPAAVEKDPYFAGWLYRVLPADLEYDLKSLSSCSPERL
ncbi:MAG: response regulator [Elusimicrobia bacterium]|nr:response regulator [Elusimicrobiota bacterium]